MNVFIVGSGKVGRALTRALTAAGHSVRIVSARRSLPAVTEETDLVILAVRDGMLDVLARRLARAGSVPRRAAVIHVAGALGPDVLAPLRPFCGGVGQAHPLASFASTRRPPDLKGALLLVRGDPLALRRSRELGRALGMVARTWPAVDAASYHAAAALAAGGAVALLAAAASMLESAGAPRREAVTALAKLLGTSVGNVERLGLPAALTGPIRRGDASTVRRHLAAFRSQAAEIKDVYLATARLQLALARELGEVPAKDLEAVRDLLQGRSRRPPRV